jgi:diguanylate cyclase (GGDEF)-like protein
MTDKMTFRDLLQTRSLRFWIAAGMMIAIAPVVTAAVVGFIVLNSGAIASFQNVADRQRTEIIPAQHIGMTLWDTAVRVDEFVVDGNPTHQAAFRDARTRIETNFAALLASLDAEPVARALASTAHEDWRAAEALGEELTSVSRPATDPGTIEMMERFDGEVRSASDSINAAIEHLEDEIAQDQHEANLAYERAMWLAGIGAGVCLLTIVAGVILIGRVMVASVDRLVDGATRFAEGDRAHRIDIRVPPELRRVADEFNRMIGKIDAYEDVLAERALKDALTGLPNRRAFDEAVGKHWERAQQSGQPLALLQIDIDHFKRINDTHGHGVGDEVLRWVGDTFSRQLRAGHPVFRTGGEEFVALVPDADAADAIAIAERLRTAIGGAPFERAGDRIAVTISIGSADSRGFTTLGEMVAAADAALYEAKLQGRNRSVASGARDTGKPLRLRSAS